MTILRYSIGGVFALLLSGTSALGGPQKTARRLSTGKTTRRLFGYVGPLLSKARTSRRLALGSMYEHGRGGLTQDYAEAVKWYRSAAEHGVAYAQNRLGGPHVRERSRRVDAGPRSSGEMVPQGGRTGQRHRADNPRPHVRARPGVTQDYAEAVKWYRKAADQGEPEAWTDLGFM